MKKMKKGFTLTELIAVIVILALISIVAIPAYNTIRSRILEKQYNNIVVLAEAAAAKYASVHGTNLTNIQELIDNGLIETDDGKNLVDPRNGTSMNCLLIEVSYKKGIYKTKLTDSKNCDLEEAQRENGAINIAMRDLETGDVSNILGNWGRNNVELLINRQDMDENENITSYRWSSATGHNSENETMIMDVAGVFDSVVSAEVTTNTENKYFAKANLRIDKENPVIEDVIVSGGNNWTKGRTVEIRATDKTGSGIGGYYIGLSPCSETTSFAENTQNKYTVNIDGKDIVDESTYYVCVKDKVGNIAAYDNPITLSMKDKEAPKCTYSDDNVKWTKNDVTVTIGCQDNESGCDSNFDSYSKTINYTTQTETISYTIKDNAGNETVCSKTFNVYVDKTAPTIPTTMEFVYGDWSRYTMSTWTNKDVYMANTVSSKGPSGSTDAESGVDYYQISSNGKTWEKYNYDNTKAVYKITTTGTHYRYFRAVDKVGNASEVLTKEIKIDKEKPKCSTVTGASKTWATSRTVTQNCSDNHSGCEKNIYSNEYTSTKTTDTITIKDKVGNTNTCTYDVYVDKTGPTITFDTNGNSAYAKQASTKVTVTDSGSGVDSIKYGWSTSSTSTLATSDVTSGTNLTSSCSISGDGDCYLYINACDKKSNCSTKRTKAFKIDTEKPKLTSITTNVESSDSGWCSGSVAYQAVKLSLSDNVGLAEQPVLWVYNHSYDSNPDDSSNSRSSKKNSKYYQCFGYSSTTTNVLTLKLTLYDKVGNSRNVNKSCYYSNDTCS